MPDIYQKITDITKEIGAIVKERRHQKGYSFRGIEDYLNKMHPLLRDHGVTFFPTVVAHSNDSWESSRGVKWDSSTVQVRYKFVASSDGSFEEMTVPGYGKSSDGGHEAIAMTNALKICLEQVFTIPTVDLEKAEENNGYKDSFTKEERKPTAPKVTQSAKTVSHHTNSQIKNLTAIAENCKSWDDYWAMVNTLETSMKGQLSKNVMHDIATRASECVVTFSTNKEISENYRKAKSWLWFYYILSAACKRNAKTWGNNEVIGNSVKAMMDILGDDIPVKIESKLQKLYK